MTKLASTETQLGANVRQLRAIWLGLAQTNTVIERATLAYRESVELLNGGTAHPGNGAD
jgi:hypothetical protein